MKEFIGKKSRFIEYQEKDYKNWFDDKKEKSPIYGLTSTYRKYLEEKRLEELKDRAIVLNNILRYREKNGIEIEECDIVEYMEILKILGYRK